ncbi:DUF6924 domain-containing protein [Kitasatospora kifunensis]
MAGRGQPSGRSAIEGELTARGRGRENVKAFAPAAVHDAHANLSIANMDFAEFAAMALAGPEGILRPER